MKKYQIYIKGKWIDSHILKFLYSLLISYKEKLFKIIFFEIYYSIIYFGRGKSFKPPDIHPCPYYFIRKISQFINKKKINSIVDLGCGFGRLTNFLNNTTNAKIYGYEVDKEVFDIANKNKGKNVTIKLGDILNIDYNNLNVECFIVNDPFYKLTKENLIAHESLIKKIEQSRMNLEQKYYLIVINVNETRNYIYNNQKLIKVVSAGSLRKIKFYSS